MSSAATREVLNILIAQEESDKNGDAEKFDATDDGIHSLIVSDLRGSVASRFYGHPLNGKKHLRNAPIRLDPAISESTFGDCVDAVKYVARDDVKPCEQDPQSHSSRNRGAI